MKTIRVRGGNPTELRGGRRLLCELLDGSDPTNRPVGKVALIDQGTNRECEQYPAWSMAADLRRSSVKGEYVIRPGATRTEDDPASGSRTFISRHPTSPRKEQGEMAMS